MDNTESILTVTVHNKQWCCPNRNRHTVHVDKIILFVVIKARTGMYILVIFNANKSCFNTVTVK